jgi:hypothetical protein
LGTCAWGCSGNVLMDSRPAHVHRHARPCTLALLANGCRSIHHQISLAFRFERPFQSRGAYHRGSYPWSVVPQIKKDSHLNAVLDIDLKARIDAFLIERRSRSAPAPAVVSEDTPMDTTADTSMDTT